MRQAAGIIFLLIFGFSVVQPVLPVLEYVINYDFISTVLCINKDEPELHCDGKCYLMKRIKKANDDKESQTSTFPIVEWEKIPVILNDQMLPYFIENILFKPDVFSFRNQYFDRIEAAPPTPPPKV